MGIFVPKARGTRSLGRRTARGAADWRVIAGPPDACRTCGGALEVRGIACDCARPEEPPRAA